MLKVLSIFVLTGSLLLGDPAFAQHKNTAIPAPQGRVNNLRITDADFGLGPKNAKVVIVEYASLTCGHCSEFHTLVLPELKREFIKTGKVRYIYRDFPLDRFALAAAMVARCADKDNFFGFIDTFYRVQSQWAKAADPISALNKLARLGGMDQNTFNQCLINKDIQESILNQRLEAVNNFDVRSTPTVFINGDQYSGGMALKQFQKIIRDKLSK
jgi:protein-disulfide isomerase